MTSVCWEKVVSLMAKDPKIRTASAILGNFLLTVVSSISFLCRGFIFGWVLIQFGNTPDRCRPKKLLGMGTGLESPLSKNKLQRLGSCRSTQVREKFGSLLLDSLDLRIRAAAGIRLIIHTVKLPAGEIAVGSSRF